MPTRGSHGWLPSVLQSRTHNFLLQTISLDASIRYRNGRKENGDPALPPSLAGPLSASRTRQPPPQLGRVPSDSSGTRKKPHTRHWPIPSLTSTSPFSDPQVAESALPWPVLCSVPRAVTSSSASEDSHPRSSCITLTLRLEILLFDCLRLLGRVMMRLLR